MLLADLIEQYEKRGGTKIPKFSGNHNIFKQCGLNMNIEDMDVYTKRIGVPPCFTKDEDYLENIDKILDEKIAFEEEKKKYKYTKKENLFEELEVIAPKVEIVKIPKISGQELMQKIKQGQKLSKSLKAVLDQKFDYEAAIEEKFERHVSSSQLKLKALKEHKDKELKELKELNDQKELRGVASTSSLFARASTTSGKLTRTSSMAEIKSKDFNKTLNKFPNTKKFSQKFKEDEKQEKPHKKPGRTASDNFQYASKDKLKHLIGDKEKGDKFDKQDNNDQFNKTNNSGFNKTNSTSFGRPTTTQFNSFNKTSSTGTMFNKTKVQFGKTRVSFDNVKENDNVKESEKEKEIISGSGKEGGSSKYSVKDNNIDNDNEIKSDESVEKIKNKDRFESDKVSDKVEVSDDKRNIMSSQSKKLQSSTKKSLPALNIPEEAKTKQLRNVNINPRVTLTSKKNLIEKNRIFFENERMTKLKQDKNAFLNYLYDKLINREYNTQIQNDIFEYFADMWRVSQDQIAHAVKKVKVSDNMKSIIDIKKNSMKFDIPETYKPFASTYGTEYGAFELKNSLLKDVTYKFLYLILFY